MSMTDKIRKLWAKANNEAATEAERDLFAAKASELMLEHAIAEDDLTEPAEFSMRDYTVGKSGSTKTVRLMSLLVDIAKPHSVRVLYMDNTRSPETGEWGFKVATLYGRTSSIDGVLAIYERLAIDMIAGASAVKIDETHPEFNPYVSKAANTRRARTGFMVGYSAAVRVRLTEMVGAKNEETGGGLLPVLASDAAKAEAMLPSYRKAAGSSLGVGHAAGMAAGNRAQLGGAAMPAGRRALATA